MSTMDEPPSDALEELLAQAIELERAATELRSQANELFKAADRLRQQAADAQPRAS